MAGIYFNGRYRFLTCDALAWNHGSCVHQLGLEICFDEKNYRDSLKANLIREICYFPLAFRLAKKLKIEIS